MLSIARCGDKPCYFFFQFKDAAWLIPARWQVSATGAPSMPRFNMNALCASEKNSMPSSSPFPRSLGENTRKTPIPNGPVLAAEVRWREGRLFSRRRGRCSPGAIPAASPQEPCSALAQMGSANGN